MKIYFNGELKSGAYIQNAMIIVGEDAGMNEIVKAIKELNFITFQLPTMKKLVKIA